MVESFDRGGAFHQVERKFQSYEMHGIQTSLFGHRFPPLDLSQPSRRWSGQPVGIMVLPTEILLWIFNLLASASKRTPFKKIHYTQHLKNPDLCDCDPTWTMAAFSRRTLFPYAQAKVCAHWRDVLSLQPAFWTRIIVSWERGEYTPPKLFNNYLIWSRNLPIEVYIGCDRDTKRFPDERDLIQRYTEILVPHVHRCRVIEYEVKYATSLPSIVDSFYDITWQLVSLRFHSLEIYDPAILPTSHVPNTMGIDRRTKATYEDIVLRELTLDGRNFLLATEHMPGLIQNVRANITIQNYSHLHLDKFFYPTGVVELPTLRLFQVISENTDLKELVLQNVTLETTVNPDTALPIAFDLEVKTLKLIDIDSKLLYSFMVDTGYVDEEFELILEACDFHEPNSRIRFPDEVITLRKTNRASLERFFGMYDGGNITYEDCPELTDEVLFKSLTRVHLGPLSKITISDCPGISVDGLKRLFSSLHYGITHSTFTPFLAVKGAKMGMSAEDKRHFRQTYPHLHLQWHANIPVIPALIECGMVSDPSGKLSEFRRQVEAYTPVVESQPDANASRIWNAADSNFSNMGAWNALSRVVTPLDTSYHWQPEEPENTDLHSLEKYKVLLEERQPADHQMDSSMEEEQGYDINSWIND